MGLFNNNNNDEEYLTVLGEIRDNLNTGLNDDRFNEIIRNLETRINDVKNDNENELCSIDDTVNNLADKIDGLENIVNLQSKQLDENYNLIKKQETQINQLISVVDKYTKIIKIMNEPVTDDVENKPTKWQKIPTDAKFKKEDKPVNTIRQYSKTIREHKPQILRITKKGKFILKSGKISQWDINKILHLQKLIPQIDLNMHRISEKVQLSDSTTARLCCAIEDGDFDQYFKEWEQMNINNHFKKYGNWKPNIENNPQKRKEKGYC